MRRMIHTTLLSLLAACAYHSQAVRLAGPPAELRALAGRWHGEYTGIESGRTGSITFEVTAQGDSAFGDVLLTAPGDGGPIMAVDPREMHLAHVAAASMLNIQFVRISGDEVRGTLEPYRAPDCGCVVHTVFTGKVSRDRVSGRFLTRLPDGREQHGTWRVARAKR